MQISQEPWLYAK